MQFYCRICDTPNEVRDLIFEKNKINNKARLLAGYCLDWIKDGKNKSDVYDIIYSIDDEENENNMMVAEDSEEYRHE